MFITLAAQLHMSERITRNNTYIIICGVEGIRQKAQYAKSFADDVGQLMGHRNVDFRAHDAADRKIQKHVTPVIDVY